MTVPVMSFRAGSLDEARGRIETLLEEIEALASSGVASGEFYPGLLQRTLTVLAAAGGAIWVVEPPGGEKTLKVRPAAVGGCLKELSSETAAAHLPLIEFALRKEPICQIPPPVESAEPGSPRNPTDFLILLGVVPTGGDRRLVIEILQRLDGSREARAGYLHVLKTVCELASRYVDRSASPPVETERVFWGKFEQFSRRIHATLDLDATAYAIANQGRSLIGCDRLAVAVYRGRACRVLAVSGVELCEKRSSTVRALESLATAVCAGREAVWCNGPTDLLPPQIRRPLNEYVDRSLARTVGLVPLQGADFEATAQTRPVTGCLIIEWFAQSAEDGARSRTEAVAEQAGLALDNALEHSALPRLVRGLFGRRGPLRVRHWPRAAVVLGLLMTMAAALLLIPADFEVEARGELQPQQRRDVFAPADGVVQQLFVQTSDRVAENDPLVRLRDPQLDLEFARLAGEQHTTQKKLAAVRAARSAQVQRRDDDPDEYRRLTSEEEELKQRLENLQRQSQILKRQQAALLVSSPLGDGQVLNWDLEKLLAGRPVRRGTLLMTVADLDGPWTLELKVRDDEAGHLLAARSQQSADLPVAFILASDPGNVFQSQLKTLGLRTEIDREGRPVVRAMVPVDRKQLPALRPGTTVTAKIYCGRRSIGYVWFHDLVEAVQSYILF